MSAKRPAGQDGGAAGRPAGVSPRQWGSLPEPLREFYGLGLRVQQKRARAGLSKNAAAAAVAAAAGCDPSKAKHALACAERVKPDDLIRLGGLRTKTGDPPSVNHLRRLAMVADGRHRRRLIAGLGRHGWTARELSEEIRRLKGGSGGAGGPRMAKPGSLAAGLDQVARHTRDWLRRHDVLWAPGRADWLAAPAGGVEGLPERLAEVESLLTELATAALALGGRVREVAAEVRSGRSAGPGRRRT
jgi:hypothetical protein